MTTQAEIESPNVFRGSLMERNALKWKAPERVQEPIPTGEELKKELKLARTLVKYAKLNLCYAIREVEQRKEQFIFLEDRLIQLEVASTPVTKVARGRSGKAEAKFLKKLGQMSIEELQMYIDKLKGKGVKK